MKLKCLFCNMISNWSLHMSLLYVFHPSIPLSLCFVTHCCVNTFTAWHASLTSWPLFYVLCMHELWTLHAGTFGAPEGGKQLSASTSVLYHKRSSDLSASTSTLSPAARGESTLGKQANIKNFLDYCFTWWMTAKTLPKIKIKLFFE